MKQNYFGAKRRTGILFAPASPLFLVILLIGFTFSSCKKQDVTSQQEEEVQSMAARNGQADVLNNYTGLSQETAFELQQARAATARYRNFENADKDGYVDINVVMPQMGYHFLNPALLDDHFDYTKPEILVYNKDHEGQMQLVAVEYAVPIPLTPNTAPAGFTGTGDVWKYDTVFNLWLLHAWVWNFNPEGVFHPTNPLVHLH